MDGLHRFMVALEDLGLKVEERGALAIVSFDLGPGGSPGPHLLATDPPNDFPNVPPHWLHLRKGITLPGDSRKPSDPGQPSDLGADWWRWSRLHPRWKGGPNAARQWAAHVRSLLLLAKVA